MTDMPMDMANASEVSADSTSARDFDAEARQHGWTPREDFKGDPSRWVDAETFIKRADEVMPLLKKQNAGLKSELDDLKRQIKQASKHFEQAEQRAYERAKAELEAKKDNAIEAGDRAEVRRIEQQMDALKPAKVEESPTSEAPSQEQLRAELNAWIETNDWYVLDDSKRRYADIQADLMGPADKWSGGQKAWLTELEKRVSGKFAEKDDGEGKPNPKPNVTVGGGNRPGGRSGKTYADLPPEAKRLCDKWVKTGLIKDREAYVKSYKFD